MELQVGPPALQITIDSIMRIYFKTNLSHSHITTIHLHAMIYHIVWYGQHAQSKLKGNGQRKRTPTCTSKTIVQVQTRKSRQGLQPLRTSITVAKRKKGKETKGTRTPRMNMKRKGRVKHKTQQPQKTRGGVTAEPPIQQIPRGKGRTKEKDERQEQGQGRVRETMNKGEENQKEKESNTKKDYSFREPAFLK